MIRKTYHLSAALALTAMIPLCAEAGTLRGSPSSMEQQHEIAVEEDMTFARKASQVKHLVESGGLVAVEPNDDLALSKVSFPYARPEVRLFVERLAAQYHADIGEKLVVTSLTRPTALQPRNAHKLSVHPAGMAVDFRIPSTAKGRAWLEKALLGLENGGLLDVTRERHPPHYHVAVFPAEYLAYAKGRIAQEPPVPNAAEPDSKAAPSMAPAASAAAQENESQRAPLVAASMLTLMLSALAPVVAKRSGHRLGAGVNNDRSVNVAAPPQ